MKWAGALSVVSTRLSAGESLFLNVPLYARVFLRKWLIKVMLPECGELKMTALRPRDRNRIIEQKGIEKGSRELVSYLTLVPPNTIQLGD
jgi:hypothetical protein